MKYQQVYVRPLQIQLALHWVITKSCDSQLWDGKFYSEQRYRKYGVKLEDSGTLVMSSLIHSLTKGIVLQLKVSRV